MRLPRSVVVAASLGFEVAFAVIGGILLGLWADEKLGTTPWLLIAGCVLGTAGAVVRLFSYLKRVYPPTDKSEDQERGQPR